MEGNNQRIPPVPLQFPNTIYSDWYWNLVFLLWMIRKQGLFSFLELKLLENKTPPLFPNPYVVRVKIFLESYTESFGEGS